MPELSKKVIMVAYASVRRVALSCNKKGRSSEARIFLAKTDDKDETFTGAIRAMASLKRELFVTTHPYIVVIREG